MWFCVMYFVFLCMTKAKQLYFRPSVISTVIRLSFVAKNFAISSNRLWGCATMTVPILIRSVPISLNRACPLKLLVSRFIISSLEEKSPYFVIDAQAGPIIINSCMRNDNLLVLMLWKIFTSSCLIWGILAWFILRLLCSFACDVASSCNVCS